jgi:hypothetical protein
VLAREQFVPISGVGQPRHLHFPLHRLEFRVAGGDFGVLLFGQRGGETVGVGQLVPGFEEGRLFGLRLGLMPQPNIARLAR